MKDGKLAIDQAEKDDVRAVQGGLVEFQPLLEALTQVRTQSSNWDDLWIIDFRSEELSSHLLFQSMRLLALKAQVDMATGEVHTARKFLDANMRLAKCFASAPGLDSEVFRQIADIDTRGALYLGLKMQAWRDEDLRAFLEFYTQQNVLGQYRWALQTGRTYWAEFCEKNLGTNFGSRVRWNDLRSWQLKVRSSRTRWWRINGEWLQRFFEEEIAGFNGERGMWSVPQPRKFDIHKVDPNDVDFDLVNNVRMLMGEVSRRGVFTHAVNKMAGIGCALELHRRKHSQYPEQLEELIPDFFTVLPNDPCGGKPFRYRSDEKEGYLLYSIGADERDDGGKIGGEWNHPDWRWWAPRTKE